MTMKLITSGFRRLCLLGLLLSCTVLAAEPPGVGLDAGKPFATVSRIRGAVFAGGGIPGGDRALREGDSVYVGDRVRATAAAEAVLKTLDAGIVAVRPGAEFVAERFVAEGKATDGSVLRVLTGSLRLITGWIGHSNRVGNLVHTPTATIGIRGTDHEPYVMSAEMAKKTANREGTYNKVNRGRTALEVGEHSLEIDAGRVGFAPTPPKMPIKKRALLTLLMPVLLDTIPDFYVPGEFDAELDQYSETADLNNRRELERIGGTVGAADAKTSAPPVAPAPAAAPAPATSTGTASPSHLACDPAGLGKAWVDALDSAIIRLDASAIIAAFAPEVVVRSSVRNRDGGMTTVEMGRDDLARSTLAAVKTLEGYRQRRVSMEASLAMPSSAVCDRIAIKSVVIEQGRQSGKSFRFESLEEYLIELRTGKWLAIKAETTQR